MLDENLKKSRYGKFTASSVWQLFEYDRLTEKQNELLNTLLEKDKRTDKQEAELAVLLKKRDNPKSSATRDNYIMKVAEAATKGWEDTFFSKHTEHGNRNEDEAIESFRKVSGLNVIPSGQDFVKYGKDAGATPDFYILDAKGKKIACGDTKCPTADFFKQKMMIINDSKPEYQNCPKIYYWQGQMQMLATKTNKFYLVRYLTSATVDEFGNKIEFNLPLETRIFWKVVKKDPKAQALLKQAIKEAASERDLYIKIFKTPII